MDTSRPVVTEIATRASSTGSTPKRQQRTVEEKRRIVEETLIEGASVARVARAHGVNANQVFGWRRLYLAEQLGGSGAIKLLPVQVKGSPALATLPRVEDSSSTSLSGTIWRELSNLLMNPERIELGLRTGARLARC